MTDGRYHYRWHGDIVRLAKRRREHPEEFPPEEGDEPTGRHSLPPPEVIERQVREFKPDDVYVMRWVRALVIVGGAVVAIVLGTLSGLSWLDGRIQERTAPVQRRLDAIEGKLDRVLEEVRR